MTVEDALVRVRDSDIWKRAVPYVNVDGQWKKAVPFVKQPSGWKAGS